jgi:menaquinol-cytochrome c reductase iron-sulfur subunit
VNYVSVVYPSVLRYTVAMSAEPTRRDFLGRTLTFVLGGVSALGTLFLPLRAIFGVAGIDTVQVAAGDIPLGKLSEFPDRTAREVRLRAPERDAWMTAPTEVGSVYVVRSGASAHVLSATCPHLGCPVDYDARTHQFECPCHRSIFALDGQRISGPAPRGLDPLQSAIVDDELSCRFVRFQPGRPDRRVI